MNRIERLMRKLIPDLDREARERERATNEVVKKSAEQRKATEDAVFDAYRRAGIAVSTISRRRKWED